MIDWVAVAAIGQIVAAFGTLATLAFAIKLAAKADRDANKANLAVLQHTRLMAAGMRVLALAVRNGQFDDATGRAVKEMESQVAEIERDFHGDRNSAPPPQTRG